MHAQNAKNSCRHQIDDDLMEYFQKNTMINVTRTIILKLFPLVGGFVDQRTTEMLIINKYSIICLPRQRPVRRRCTRFSTQE